MATRPTNANVTKLYIATFGRAPDAAGLNYWVNNSGLTLEQIAKSFFDQPETKAKFGGATNEAFVRDIYVNVLGREGEPAGVAYWVGELNAGRLTRDNIILAVLGGAQGSDATLLENRTQIGMYYAEKNSTINPFDVMKFTTAQPESVGLAREMIDGKLQVRDGTPTFLINDPTKSYDNLKGTALADTFIVEAFKSAKGIDGGDGSDTLDFSDYSKAVEVNLSTGTGPDGMTFQWIENVIGTSRVDTLTGNADHNILVANGGADKVDAGAGNDVIKFRNMTDVKGSADGSLNGGTGRDTLIITNDTEITVNADTFKRVSDLEKLVVGYRDEAKQATAFTTIDVTDADFKSIKEVQVVGTNGAEVNVDAGVTALNTLSLMDFAGSVTINFKGDAALPTEIRAPNLTDRNGKTVDDVIKAAGDLNASKTKLSGIEVLQVTAADKTITVGKSTLESVRDVVGHTDGSTKLALSAAADDTFNLTVPNFKNIDEVQQLKVDGKDVASKIIVNQSLINSLAANKANDKDGFTAGFSESALVAAGIGLDLSVLLDTDGASAFKALEFGTAREVTIGAITGTTLKTITGSVNTDDMLRIKPNDGTEAVIDMSSITIKDVERLDFEEIGVVKFKGLPSGVKQISGDNDRQYADGSGAIMGGYGTHLFNATAATATAGNALDLRGVNLIDIGGFAGNGDERQYLIDGKTSWDSNFKSLNGKDDGTGVESAAQSGVNPATKVTIVADSKGTYDLSKIAVAEAAKITLNDDCTIDNASNDRFIGSKEDDIVRGGSIGLYYDLGAGNDEFTGGAGAEVILGGAGNDKLTLDDNDKLGSAATPVVITDAENSIINTANGGVAGVRADYVKFAGDIDGAGTNLLNAGLFLAKNATDIATGKGAYADGGEGDDQIFARKGDDLLIGGKGGDTLQGGEHNDVLCGGEGDDILSGDRPGIKISESGSDFLAGGAGNDTIQGDHGEDFIFGGKGRDGLRGGTEDGNAGARDHFIFEAGDSGNSLETIDIIWDFVGKLNTQQKGVLVDGDSPVVLAPDNSDVLYFNWFASAAAAGNTKDATNTPIGAAAASINNLADNTGNASVALTGGEGTAYDTFFYDAQNSLITGNNPATNFLDAANAALKAAYAHHDLGTALGGGYTSVAAQFEYGGKEYLVIDALVTNNANSVAWAENQGLIVQIANNAVSWSLSADDIVVTRWEAM